MKTFAVSFRSWCAIVIGLFFAPLASHGNILDILFPPNDLETVTVTDVTPAGNRLRQPTPDHPLYYTAVSAGYYDFGGLKAGEKPISRQSIDQTMLKILAKQGYLPAAPGQDPDVVLAWSWGTLNVDVLMDGSGSTFRLTNELQLLRFLGGAKLGLISKHKDSFPELTLQPGLLPLSGDAQNLIDASKDDLYVAVISAYAVKLRDSKRAELLWNTRISAPSRGFWMPEALLAMLAIASPYVDRETSKPIWIHATDKFRPDIRLGDTRMVEYLEKTPATVVAVGRTN
jgi:hypothetical protein